MVFRLTAFYLSIDSYTKRKRMPIQANGMNLTLVVRQNPVRSQTIDFPRLRGQHSPAMILTILQLVFLIPTRGPRKPGTAFEPYGSRHSPWRPSPRFDLARTQLDDDSSREASGSGNWDTLA